MYTVLIEWCQCRQLKIIVEYSIKCSQLSKPKANGNKGEKGDSGKEPKLHPVTEWRKNLERNQARGDLFFSSQ